MIGALASALLLVATQPTGSARSREPFKLEGAWIMKFPGTPITSVYTLSADTSGRRASISGSTIIGDPTFFGSFPAEWQSPLMGEAVVTGPNEGRYTAVSYGLKAGAEGFPELVYILVDSGMVRDLGQGRTEHQHNLGVYLPFQDADGDGLPDAGQTPVACVPLTSISTRIPVLPACWN